MLPDQSSELLTAFVDGELSQPQRQAVMRLLEQSPEARELLRQLQENAHRVNQLPRRKVDPSLVSEVLQAIIAPRTLTATPIRRAPRRNWLPIVAASLAASVMIAAMGVLFWLATREPDNKSQITSKDKKPIIEKIPEPKLVPEPSPKTPNKALESLLTQMATETPKGFIAPVPNEQPFTTKFGDIRPRTIGLLAYELNREKSAHLDITVKDNPVALDRLKNALHDLGIKVAVDPNATKALKIKNQARVEYWVYAENLTSDEVAKMLQDLSLPYTAGKRFEASPYQKLTLTGISKTENQQLSRLLGVDAAKMENPKERSEDTQVNSNVRWNRTAVVLPAAAGKQTSEEVRRFAGQLRRPQPGTVQVLIKIRQE